ncbi:uncharacterized protein F4812DRAFT_416979 [Daldinia caldariorum]|uniref:uncharacterized protein n=1 Tax=Daldinia caldariorum TaxID=326644 RepID=UPI002007DA1E|nr:uncharacterized protein F4812DRAFT_416979 [Daldinia caldariorum]KAI1470299.1 hypothetical protein F4812DRAFT_416979 [Daldinia caldariorum]
MTISNETIVAIITLLIMCFIPALRFLIHLFCRRRARSTQGYAAISLELVPGPNELAVLESGMFYATRNIRVDTLIVRSLNIPNLRHTVHHDGSELDAIRAWELGG